MDYGPEQPLTASTLRATTTPVGEIQPTDSYRQIIPGMSECLYHTLTADFLLSTPASDDCSTLHNKGTKSNRDRSDALLGDPIVNTKKKKRIQKRPKQQGKY